MLNMDRVIVATTVIFVFFKVATAERSFIPSDNGIGDRIYFYTRTKLSWNDANSFCENNNSPGLLLKLQNHTEIEELRSRESLKVYPLWIGLARPSTMSPSPIWTDCEPYNSSNYNQSFERPDNTAYIEWRCALLHDDLSWDWRDCSEPHSFACNNQGTILLPRNYLPICGKEDRSLCPKFNNHCIQEEECFLIHQSVWIEHYRDNCTSITPQQGADPTPSTTPNEWCYSPDVPTTPRQPSSTTADMTEATTDSSTTESSTTGEQTETEPTTEISTQTETTSDSLTETTVPQTSTDGSTTSSADTTVTTPLSTSQEAVTEPNIYACNTSCQCRCRCVKTVYLTPEDWGRYREQRNRWIEDILEELSLNRSAFSSTRRRYSSAVDTRPSAKTIGSLGIFILVLALSGIILLDLSALVTDITRFWKNIRNVFQR